MQDSFLRYKPNKLNLEARALQAHSSHPHATAKQEVMQTGYFIGSSNQIQLVFKQLAEIYAKLVEKKQLNTDELKGTLEMAIRVSATTHFMLSNREQGEDEVMNFVPCQVRDWLATTFTRGSTIKDSRTQLFTYSMSPTEEFDKLYRPPTKQQMNQKVQRIISLLNDWSFDIFMLEEASTKQSFRHVVRNLLGVHKLISKFKIQSSTLEQFIVRTEIGYRKHKNPYHNDIHAADVGQTMNALIMQTELKYFLTDLELFACIFSALIHDFEHTGCTNSFLVNTKSDLALLYNDKAVLENFHLSRAFGMMAQEQETNILSSLTSSEFTQFRSTTIDLVLATDMSYHFEQIKKLADPNTLTFIQLLGTVLHFADISHPSKAFKVHHQWTQRLFQEFFRQGDKEKSLGLMVSPLCDRDTTLLPQSQCRFIDIILIPTLDNLFHVLPFSASFKTQTSQKEPNKPGETLKMKTYLKNIMLSNKDIWTKMLLDKEEMKRHK